MPTKWPHERSSGSKYGVGTTLEGPSLDLLKSGQLQGCLAHEKHTPPQGHHMALDIVLL